MGDSGTGKTGSLVSLVQAGYKLRILDFDSGLHVLGLMVRKHCPDLLDNIHYRTLDDKFKVGPGGTTIQPYAWIEACKMINNWKYKEKDGTEVDLGHPWEWGPEYILVIDSLTFMADAAYNWADAMNPSVKDKRQIYGEAQGALEHMLAQLKADTFCTNIIVIAHIKYIDQGEGPKGFPTAVGSALSPNIPKYFNSVLRAQTKMGGKRTIQTVSSALVDLKNPAAFSEELPLETGMAQFFAALKGQPWQTKTISKETKTPTPSSPLSTPSTSSPEPTKTSQMALGAPRKLISL